MKQVVKIVYLLSSIIFMVYLIYPAPLFPTAPENSIQSNEPADIETPLRRSYYTDASRNDVMDIYRSEFAQGIFNSKYLTFELNYPPEEAQTLIRDQARSTFLEEIVHPFRESIFVSGFEPKEDKDKIIVNNKNWRQKITVKYVQSNALARVLLGIIVILFLPIVVFKLKEAMTDLFVTSKKIWTYR